MHGPCPPTGLCLPCSLVRVTDGDTVIVRVVLQRAIRLLGVDCEKTTTPKGAEAARVATELLEAADHLRLWLPSGRTDETFGLTHSFERLPGHIFLDSERTLSQLLREKGLAEPWKPGQKGLG